MAIRKEDLVKFLRGHAAADQRVAQERARRLSMLTEQAARNEFEDLSRVWYSSLRNPEVDPERLAALLRVRQALKLLNERGHDSSV